jgi:hypothetical protein
VKQSVDTSAAPSPPAVIVMNGEFSDFDELAGTVAGWGLDWIQLDRG